MVGRGQLSWHDELEGVEEKDQVWFGTMATRALVRRCGDRQLLDYWGGVRGRYLGIESHRAGKRVSKALEHHKDRRCFKTGI